MVLANLTLTVDIQDKKDITSDKIPHDILKMHVGTEIGSDSEMTNLAKNYKTENCGVLWSSMSFMDTSDRRNI